MRDKDTLILDSGSSVDVLETSRRMTEVHATSAATSEERYLNSLLTVSTSAFHTPFLLPIDACARYVPDSTALLFSSAMYIDTCVVRRIMDCYFDET